MMLAMGVIGADGEVRHWSQGRGEVTLGWRGLYHEGDRIVVCCDEDSCRLVLSVDERCAPSVVLVRGGRVEFEVPFGDRRKPYGKDVAFGGERHWAFARALDPREVGAWRNLALNSADQPLPVGHACTCFPHASTNVVCDNPQFWARNAIDGIFETCGHGSWPHGSWGINGNPEAWLRVDFGEPVVADELRLYLRADFPHDTWWTGVTAELSDGTELPMSLLKTGARQSLDLGGRTVEWVRVKNLRRAEERGFPALSQLMVMGRVMA